MSNVIDFNKYKNKVTFDPMIDKDPYLRLTFANIVEAYNLSYDTESVKYLQSEILDYTNPDGIVGIEEIVGLSVIFDYNQRQEIIAHISDNYVDNNGKVKSEKEPSRFETFLGYAIIFLILFALIVGCIDIWKIIYNFIHSLF